MVMMGGCIRVVMMGGCIRVVMIGSVYPSGYDWEGVSEWL